MAKNVYSVKQVNAYIKNMFTQDFMLNRIYVKGEISNCKYHTSGHIYFSLKDDGHVARVRFMYNNIDDIEGYAVHEVEVDGRKKYVNCLREYNSRLDDCPFCKAKKFQSAKLFIPLYNIDEDKVQIWERGKTYFSIISGLFARYSSADTPLVSQVFEIERNGKKGDTATRYGIFPVGQPDDTTLEDLPEVPAILGTQILDKSFE